MCSGERFSDVDFTRLLMVPEVSACLFATLIIVTKSEQLFSLVAEVKFQCRNSVRLGQAFDRVWRDLGFSAAPVLW